jgi:hypothetical protein
MERAPRLGPQEWSARYETTQNFLVVQVEPGRLTVRALAATAPGGEAFAEIDSVEIPRNCSWPAMDLATIPVASINLDGTPKPLRPALLIGGGVLFVAALALKLARRRRKKAA